MFINCSHRYSQSYWWNQETIQETYQTDSLGEEDEALWEVSNKKTICRDIMDGNYFRWNRSMRRKCRNICKSQWMFWLIVTLVFLNTCVLATEHHHQPEWLDDFQVRVNLNIEYQIQLLQYQYLQFGSVRTFCNLLLITNWISLGNCEGK